MRSRAGDPLTASQPARWGARVLFAVGAAAAIVALAGCGAATGTGTGTGQQEPRQQRPQPPYAVSQTGPAACSAGAPASLAAEGWAAARAQLAPPGASAIRLCRYSGLNAHPRLALVSSRLLTSSAVVRELVDELDHLAPLPPNAISCPNDDGSQMIALLAYPDGHSVTISVGLTDCEVVTNGSVQRTAVAIGSTPAAGPPLVSQLERLLAGAGAWARAGMGVSGHGAGSAAALTHGHWSVLARSPLGPRFGATVAWDGRELLEIGGDSGDVRRGPR